MDRLTTWLPTGSKEVLMSEARIQAWNRANEAKEATGIINLETLAPDRPVRYALAVCNADVRSVPSRERATKTPGGRFDYHQETKLRIGEAVCVCGSVQGEDGLTWQLVQARNYRGFVESGSLAFGRREACLSYLKQEPFAVAVKSGWLKSADGREGVGGVCPNRVYIRMGTRLPCCGGSGIGGLKLPVRDAMGRLRFVTTAGGSIEGGQQDEALFTTGYLPFTEETLLQQVKRLLGTPYSWGDETETGMDCSSTVGALYACFGFVLPRNTGAQREMAGEHFYLKGCSPEKKRRLLAGLPLGSLLYIPGHVMLYLGEKQGVPYIFHNFEGYEKNKERRLILRAAVTPLLLGEEKHTYLDRLEQAFWFQKAVS